MGRVCNDHEALVITRNSEQSVVMLSLEDYKALEETAPGQRQTLARRRRAIRRWWRPGAGTG